MKRLVLGVASLFTAWHLFATFLWIAPPSALRDVVPGNALSNYMIPFFGQSWSVFAPEPINGDFYFDVRAVLDEGNGELSTTDWKRATDVEQSRSEYNLFPPRSSNLGVAVASNLKDSWDQLNEDQRAVVALGYFKGSDWQDRLHSTMAEYSENKGTLDSYLEHERVATAYATQVAKAIWGDQVVRVQFQAARQNVVPFEQRHNSNAERPGIQPVPVGWRATVVEADQSEEHFAHYFCSAPTKVCETRE